MDEAIPSTERNFRPRSNSDVRRLINEIENKHVRILNNNTDIRRHRIPVPRVQSRERIKLIQEQLFGSIERRHHSSVPSLVKSQKPTQRNRSTVMCGDNFNASHFNSSVPSLTESDIPTARNRSTLACGENVNASHFSDHASSDPKVPIESFLLQMIKYAIHKHTVTYQLQR